MRNLSALFFLAIVALFVSCDESSSGSSDEFTGKEIAFDLQQASDFPISGTVTFKERTDLCIGVT